MIRETINSIISKKVNQWQVFSNLLSVLSSSSILMFVSGYLYEKAYFKAFFIDADRFDHSISYYLSVCLDEVILHSIFTFIIVTGLFGILIVLFYIATNSNKAWSGYGMLCLLLLFMFALSVFAGNIRGKSDAQRDWSTETSHLPSVRFSFDNPEKFDTELIRLGERSGARLLHETEEYIYVIETRQLGDQSDLPVHLLHRKEITSFSIYHLEK